MEHGIYGGVIFSAVSGSPQAAGFIPIYADGAGAITTFCRTNSVDFVNEATGITLSTATWYHFAVTWDGTGDGKIRVYKDGSLAFTSAGASTSAMTGLVPMGFGGLQWADGSYNSFVNADQSLVGSADEIGLWSKALNATYTTLEPDRR